MTAVASRRARMRRDILATVVRPPRQIDPSRI